MWVHVDEEKYISDELFSDIRKNFASKAAPSKTSPSFYPSRHSRVHSLLGRQPIHDLVDKSKELRVLDSKAAQNFGTKQIPLSKSTKSHASFYLAIMFSQLKAQPSVFREWMLACDNESLKDDFLKQLEKYLPTADELKALAELKTEINDLQYSEQYFCAVSFRGVHWHHLCDCHSDR